MADAIVKVVNNRPVVQVAGVPTSLLAEAQQAAQMAQQYAERTGAGLATKAVATKADLASIPAPALRDSVLVTSDPAGDVANGNGVYSWNGSGWVWITPRVDPAVSSKLDPLDEWSRALAKPSDLTLVGRYEQANGSFSSTLTFKASPLLPVEGGRQYSITATTAGDAASVWFDEAGAFISSFGVNQAFGTTITVTAPDNARFVGLTNNSSSTTMAAFSARSVSGSFNLPALKKAVDQVREPRDAVVDAKTSILQSENDALAARVDMLLGRLGNRYAMGNRVLGIGDSTMRGTYGGDAEPGVDGSTLTVAGDSWISHMCFSTDQAITRVANAGHIGSTVAEELSRFDDYVVSRKPQTVLISGGTNDAVASPQTTSAAFRGAIEAMIVKARSAGITPVLVTPLPSANSPLYSILTAYNAELRSLADKHNLLYLDLYTFAQDPQTGGLKSEYSGDGVHPSAAGQKAMGEYAASVLKPLVIGSAPPFAVDTLDPRNIAPNPLFAGTPGANGQAPSWFISGSLPAGAVASVVTRAGVVGKLQRLQATDTTAVATLLVPIPTSKWSVGDLIEINGRFFSYGPGVARRWVEVTDGRQDRAISTSLAAHGAFHLRKYLRGDAASLDVMLRIDAGTGDLEIGQLMVRNLTREGLDG